jgi:hypothetical protein
MGRLSVVGLSGMLTLFFGWRCCFGSCIPLQARVLACVSQGQVPRRRQTAEAEIVLT